MAIETHRCIPTTAEELSTKLSKWSFTVLLSRAIFGGQLEIPRNDETLRQWSGARRANPVESLFYASIRFLTEFIDLKVSNTVDPSRGENNLEGTGGQS
jgi:hypothetical protein